MATCATQQSSTKISPITYSQNRFHPTTYDSRKTPMLCRKRLLSEQNDRYVSSMKCPDDADGIIKKTKGGLFDHESKDKYYRHGTQHSSLSFIERKRYFRSAPSLLRRRSLTHHSHFTCIKHIASAQTTITFHPPLSTLTTTTTKTQEKNMLVCPQTPTIVINHETDEDYSSDFLTCSELAAFISNINRTKLIIDCGSPLRHTERRIRDSLLLNVNDKISRKRLSTRGLKSFLDADQLNRFDKNEFIILYDDSSRASPCSNASVQSHLSPAMKCIYDEIKRYDANKTIYILQTSFNEFHQHHPSFCYISTSTDEDLSVPVPPSPVKQSDIEFCQISEVLPGLYLGNARDAEDLSLLKQHQIKTIINASTSIPCHFENETIFEYLRLPCHDSVNQNILQYFETTFEYIHQKLSANRNVFVHCQGGVSRSPSFIIGYLMRYHSKTFDEAYKLVKSRRNIVNPNLNFLGQLIQYQQMLPNA